MSTPQPRGKLSVDLLQQLVAEEQIETVLAVMPDLYGRLMETHHRPLFCRHRLA